MTEDRSSRTTSDGSFVLLMLPSRAPVTVSSSGTSEKRTWFGTDSSISRAQNGQDIQFGLSPLLSFPQLQIQATSRSDVPSGTFSHSSTPGHAIQSATHLVSSMKLLTVLMVLAVASGLPATQAQSSLKVFYWTPLQNCSPLVHPKDASDAQDKWNAACKKAVSGGDPVWTNCG